MMKNRWTLHVNDFGKIASADITVSPITLFVGDNNSGKSYLMTLLYALLNIRFYHQKYDFCEESIEYITCANWLKERVAASQTNASKAVMPESVMEAFITLLNKILSKNKGRIIKYAFNSNVEIGELDISFQNINKISICVEHEETHEGGRASYRLCIAEDYVKARSMSADIKFFIGFILEYFIKYGIKRTAPSDCVFLPTSRTGFLLTYKSLVQSSIAEAYDTNDLSEAIMPLTRPCSDFLKNLAAIDPMIYTEKYDKILQHIEKRMVRGHVSVSADAPQKIITYRPEYTDDDLPMHLTSGVVTELTPLLLMLKYHSPMETLFIEEPEMGLHPALQHEMAKVITELCSNGIFLFVTTHSDTILQHINNMIKLSNRGDKEQELLMKEYGYTRDDVVSCADVAMYQFDVNKKTGKTYITPLKCTEFGYVVPTFNNALAKLLKESQHMEGDNDEL